jgi:uncharacterized protein (DUF58 family)
MSSEREFLDPNVIARLASMPLESRSPMIGNVSGRHRSPMRGSSLEFAQYRKYVPGDDTRRMDWRVWGRSDRCYIKEFEADTNLRMCLVVDASGSMLHAPFESLAHRDSKLMYAKKIAGTLAWLATQQGDAVGFCAANSHEHKAIPARRGPRHLKIVFDQLDRLNASGSTTLTETLHSVAESTPRRSFIVVISDLFAETSLLTEAVQHLRYRKHDIAVFHVIEANELELPFNQPMKFMDLEGGAPILADPTVIAHAYRESVKTYFSEIHEMVRTSGIDYHLASLQENHGDLLARFLSNRQTRNRSTNARGKR